MSAINLRRMGHPQKARKILWISALAFAAISVILFFIPAVLGRFAGFGVEAGACMIYPVLQGREFAGWEAAHPGIAPSSGWWAIGWGILGLFVFLAILFPVLFALALLFPQYA